MRAFAAAAGFAALAAAGVAALLLHESEAPAPAPPRAIGQLAEVPPPGAVIAAPLPRPATAPSAAVAATLREDAAAEPAFDLGALLAHDDPAALAELLVSGRLDPQRLVARIVHGGTPLEERASLIEGLAQAGTPAAQAALRAVTQDGLLGADVVGLAYDGLGRVRRPTPETLAHLGRASRDARTAHRAAAIEALGLLARSATDRVLRSRLSADLRDRLAAAREPRRRLELARGLAQTASPLAQAPLASLAARAPSPALRAVALSGLARLPGPEAEGPLLTSLEDAPAADRAAAAEALGTRRPTAEVVGALVEALERDRAPAVRATALDALLAWRQAGHLDARARAQVEAALTARAEAGDALARAALTPRG